MLTLPPFADIPPPLTPVQPSTDTAASTDITAPARTLVLLVALIVTLLHFLVLIVAVIVPLLLPGVHPYCNHIVNPNEGTD